MANRSKSQGNDIMLVTFGTSLRIPNSSGKNSVNLLIHGGLSLQKRTSGEAGDKMVKTHSGLKWTTSHSLNLDELKSELRLRRQQDYRLQNLSVYCHHGSERYLTFWTKSAGPEWAVMHGLSQNQYMDAVEAFKLKGFYVTKVTGYVINQKTKFVAIWEKRTVPNVVTKVNMTAEVCDEALASFRRAGYKLSYYSAHAVGDTPMFAAIWENPSSFNATFTCRNFSLDDLTKLCKENTQKGYVLKTVSGYRVNNADKYAALFEKKVRCRNGTLSTSNSYEEHVHQLDTIVAQKLTPTYVQAFSSGFSTKYCIIWSK